MNPLLSTRPDFPSRPSEHGYRSYATALLTAGRIPQAWRFYEFRWLTEPQLSLRPTLGQPVWSGQDLRGKLILLYAEQGIGDVIQFSRYAAEVKGLGATVFLFASKALSNLASSIPGVDRVVLPGEAVPTPDFHIHLMTLPEVFGTGLDTIPATVPYVSVTAERKERWSRRLAGVSGLRVGLRVGGQSAARRRSAAFDRARAVGCAGDGVGG